MAEVEIITPGTPSPAIASDLRPANPPLVEPAPTKAKEGKETPRLLSDGVFLLSLSASAYIGCHLYEQGYAAEFHIPPEFINISTQNLILFAGRFAALLASAGLILDLIAGSVRHTRFNLLSAHLTLDFSPFL